MSNNQTTKGALLLSTACAVVITFSGGNTAAQEVSGDGASQNRDVVIVTARKREENLQDVPISITALTQNALRDANAFGLEDVAQLTPGLQFRQIGGISEPVIRGLAQVDQIGLQGNVGTFIDGVFLNNRSSIEFGNLDLGQVEVLKGPQSTLFGRNTFAGAINYTTRSPSLGEFDATIEGEAGSHDRLGIKGSVNIPLNDFGAIRFFGGSSKFDGTIENLQDPDSNLGGWDERTTYGASALFEVDRIRVKGFYARNEVQEDQPPLRLLLSDVNNAGTIYVNDSDPSDTQATLFAGTIPNFENVNLFPSGTGNVGAFWLAYVNVDVDLGFATATGHYSRSESDYVAQFDNTGNPINVTLPLFGNAASPFSNQILTNSTGDIAEQDSYEFRLASNEGSPIDWLIGYSHYDSVTGGILSSRTPLLADPSTIEPITEISDRLDVNIDAIYGSFNIPLNDQLNVGGEIRYTDEDQININEIDLQFLSIDNDPTALEVGFEYWGGRASLDYSLNDDVLLYAYAARGIKSGGINGSEAETSPFRTFQPETNWTYELGVKSTLWDGRALFNAAVYYIDWSELQTPAPPTETAGGPIINGVGATSIGIEVDATVQVTDNFSLRVASSYTDATYDEGFDDAAIANYCGVDASPAGFSIQGTPCSIDVSGNQVARAGDFTVFASGTYEIPDLVYGFDGYLRADFSHEASPYPLSVNLAQPEARNLVNLRFGVRNDNTEVAFWVDNVLNTENIDRVTSVPDFFNSGSFGCTVNNCLSSLRVYPGNTRTWGVKVVQRF